MPHHKLFDYSGFDFHHTVDTFMFLVAQVTQNLNLQLLGLHLQLQVVKNQFNIDKEPNSK